MTEKEERAGFGGGSLVELRNDRSAGVRVHEPGTHPETLSEQDSKEVEERLEERAAARKKNGGWLGKGQPKGRKHKLATFAIDKAIVAGASDPAYGKCLKYAASYRKHRARELCVAHGYVSAGASALLATASLALAASRYLYERVAITGETDLLMKAHKLADSARQNELAAWELCAREGVARRKAQDAYKGLPWETGGAQEPAGKGRPRKATLAQQEASLVGNLPPMGSGELSGWIAGTVDVEGEDNGSTGQVGGAGEEGNGKEAEAEGDEEL
jgi:hypothetical protein